MNPIAVALFYCKLFSSITSQISWTTSQTFKFKYENLSIFLHRLILFLFQHCFFSTMVNPMIIPIHQDHLDTTLIQYHMHLSLICLVHIYSNYNCVIWVKCGVSQPYVLLLLLWCWLNLHHSTWSCSMLSNKTFEPYPQYLFLKLNSLFTYSCWPILNYSLYKWVNWVMHCFIKSIPKA
jgi:hypothetical protein